MGRSFSRSRARSVKSGNTPRRRISWWQIQSSHSPTRRSASLGGRSKLGIGSQSSVVTPPFWPGGMPLWVRAGRASRSFVILSCRDLEKRLNKHGRWYEAVRTVREPEVLQGLLRRLGTVHAGSLRRWGTMTPHEMLCHLGDATDMVLGVRPRKGAVQERHRSLVKWLGLWTPIPWPHGWPTNPALDPRAEGTRPAVFAKDLARVVSGLEVIAAPGSRPLVPTHGFFGTMSARDWQRWAYRHTNHHLRQFGA
jgi:hypothetical protein